MTAAILQRMTLFKRSIVVPLCITSVSFPFPPPRDAPGSVDIEFIETCVGGSAVLPCVPSQGEGSAVQGVSVKRRRGRAPVEVVYHSNPHHSSSSSPPSISSLFPAGKVQLSLAPSPGGITCNVTLQQLQPDDSALYSCQLHMHGRSDSSTALGRRVFFVSVQGGLRHSQEPVTRLQKGAVEQSYTLKLSMTVHCHNNCCCFSLHQCRTLIHL